MGKSGYLPDVSFNFGFWKNKALDYFQKGEYLGAESSLYSLNSCLGDDYLVTVSTRKYDEWFEDPNHKSVYQCNNCTTTISKTIGKGTEDEREKEITIPFEVPKNEVKIFDVILPLVDSIILKQNSEKIWICSNCEKENKLAETSLVNPEREKMVFLKVIWDAPKRPKIGIGYREGYSEKFQKWFWTFFEEITNQEVLYRKEYVNQHDGEDMVAYQDKGDSS